MVNFQRGLELMVAGMGTVFLFLVTLVVLMLLAGAFFQKYAHCFPEDEIAPEPTPEPEADNSLATIAVAVAVVVRERQR